MKAPTIKWGYDFHWCWQHVHWSRSYL